MKIKNVCSIENYRDFVFAQDKTLDIKLTYTRISIIYKEKAPHSVFWDSILYRWPVSNVTRETSFNWNMYFNIMFITVTSQ